MFVLCNAACMEDLSRLQLAIFKAILCGETLYSGILLTFNQTNFKTK